MYYSKTVERQNLKVAKENMIHHVQENPVILTADFLSETMTIRKQWNYIFKVLKEKK